MSNRPTSQGNTSANSGCAWAVLLGGLVSAALLAVAAYFAFA